MTPVADLNVQTAKGRARLARVLRAAGDLVTVDDAVSEDKELEQAIKTGGNVYLAMFYQPKPPGQPVRQL